MSTRDQIAVAQLLGHARRCVAGKFPVDEAVAGLREITTRPDLLAQAAGHIAGSGHPDDPTYAWHIGAARLLVRAGADRAMLPRWIAEGRQNAARSLPGLGVPPVWADDLDEVLAEITRLDGLLPRPPRLAHLLLRVEAPTKALLVHGLLARPEAGVRH